MSKLVLKDLQIKTVEYGLKNPYSIYALQQGLGKSICALVTADRKKQRTLVVCPAYLRLKWAREVHKFFDDRVVVIYEKESEVTLPIFDTDIIIISYYLLGSKKADALFEWAECVVGDEIHLVKNMEAKRTLNFHKLVYENSVKSLLLLTGTPVQNRVHEFYSLIALCNYNPNSVKTDFLTRFPDYITFADYFSFREEFDMLRGNRRVKVIKWVGYRREDELKKYLENIYIRFTADGVLPPIVIDFIPVEYKDYPELLKAFEAYSVDSKTANSTIGMKVKADCALKKAPYTIQIAKDRRDQGQVVIVYSDHVESCKKIAEGLGVPAITGEMPSSKRDILCEQFQKGEIDTIVATIGSLSTGQDLHTGNRIIFNDLPFRYGELEQVMYRIRRIGQLSESCYIDFVIGSKQDEIIYDMLQEKKRVIDGVV